MRNCIQEIPVKKLAVSLLLPFLASIPSISLAQPAQATATTAPAAAAAQPLTDAVPALWKVKGAHATVYLFGSIHVMKKDIHWENAKVKAALASSDTLYLEIADIDPAAIQAAQPEILQIGTDPQHPLSTKITKEDLDLLDTDLKGLGLPGEAPFEPMQPWLAYLTVSVLPAMKAGYDPNSGIDVLLAAEAKDAKKSVKGFETLTQQMHYMADMPQPLQVQMLHQALTDLPKAVAQTDTLVADWTRGDVEAIAKEENDDMKAKYPELYQKLLVQRNERFADSLATILKDPDTGTIFVAVGAAHLAGSDSVQKMLEKRGFTASRVE
jgi:uncharacterized protein YbaP (TraB family)